MAKTTPKEDKRRASDIYKRAGKNASPSYKNRMRRLHDRLEQERAQKQRPKRKRRKRK